jgi:pyridoxine 5-phosphate synthase
MTKLSVNVNKVATLRNTRHSGIPSVVGAARIALEAGAHGVTVHPRPDQRHIRPADVYEIAELLRAFPQAEYNIEGNPQEEYLAYARAVRPTQCTLVPDTPEAFTSDHGWDLTKEAERLRRVVETLHSYGCRVSLFLDAVPAAVERVPETGADRIELYTGPYAEAFARGDPEASQPYAETARRAADLGLGVNAGHDLNLDNLPHFLATVPQVAEVSIGHALIADALERGLSEAVRAYLRAVSR